MNMFADVISVISGKTKIEINKTQIRFSLYDA